MFSKSLPLLLGNAPLSLLAAMEDYGGQSRAWLDGKHTDVGGKKIATYASFGVQATQHTCAGSYSICCQKHFL